MEEKELETFCPASRQDWRAWLIKNHDCKQSVWLVYHKKNAGIPTVTYSDAVDEALCFGWIDSTRISLGSDQFRQFFCRRKPRSVWSKINKEKVRRLIEDGLMTPAGQACIDNAIQNGSWTILDEAEELIVPADLQKQLRRHAGAVIYFERLSPSAKKAILQWLVLAKRPETRQRRIDEIATLAAQQLKPKQFR